MENRQNEIDKLKAYKYGFSTDIENTRAPKGLNEISLKETGLIVSNLARSTNAITAYLPFDVNFILPFKLLGFYTFLTKMVKFRL